MLEQIDIMHAEILKHITARGPAAEDIARNAFLLTVLDHGIEQLTQAPGTNCVAQQHIGFVQALVELHLRHDLRTTRRRRHCARLRDRGRHGLDHQAMNAALDQRNTHCGVQMVRHGNNRGVGCVSFEGFEIGPLIAPHCR